MKHNIYGFLKFLKFNNITANFVFHAGTEVLNEFSGSVGLVKSNN